MSQLLISAIDDRLLERLRGLASLHGRTLEEEARAILTAALQPPPADPWAAAEAIRQRLAATGKAFSDSAELLREDRDR